MFYSENFQKALRFAIKTHEVYQKQKRKGKDIPYIVHPLTVAIILAKAGARENIIIAGLLHDTIEDSSKEIPVTEEMIQERFGLEVTNLVLALTENQNIFSWQERKDDAYHHLDSFSKDALMIKSADILANVNEIYDDWERDGDKIFKRFHTIKENLLSNYRRIISKIISLYPENPLLEDLLATQKRIDKISEKI